MKKTPTMRDVADRAEVSPMTVSRTLRGQDSVDPELRDRVLAAVTELGYRRNDFASKLRSRGQSGLLGLVITNLDNPFYAQLATGVEACAAEHDMQVLLGISGDDASSEGAVIEGLLSRRVEGLIVVPGAPGGQATQTSASTVPTVLVAGRSSSPHTDSVVVDDFGGAREASRRLVLEGHRRTAFLGLAHASWPASERRRGFLAGQAECEVRVDETLVVDLPSDADAADVALWRLMAAPDPPTAVFAVNNRNTLAACRWVAHTGESLRIVGFDDIPIASLLAMPLSLISYSPAELGRRAATLLMARIQHGADAPAREVVVPTQLVHHGDQVIRPH